MICLHVIPPHTKVFTKGSPWHMVFNYLKKHCKVGNILIPNSSMGENLETKVWVGVLNHKHLFKNVKSCLSPNIRCGSTIDLNVSITKSWRSKKLDLDAWTLIHKMQDLGILLCIITIETFKLRFQHQGPIILS
jgi:hypothetical protein